jgi:hypothetical protein
MLVKEFVSRIMDWTKVQIIEEGNWVTNIVETSEVPKAFLERKVKQFELYEGLVVLYI